MFNGGRLTISFADSTMNYSSNGLRVFVQPPGRILAAGGFTNNGPDGQFPGIAWVGLTPAGGIDPDFGPGGAVLVWDPHVLQTMGDAWMYPDGRTLRVSQYFSLGGDSFPKAVRLSVDGAPDTPFGTNANIGDRNTIPLETFVRSDGKILVLVGDTTHTLYRLNSDGTRDSTFGTNGEMPMTFQRIPGQKLDMSMVELPDGRILIAGNRLISGSTFAEFYIIQLSPAGHIDKSFGLQGVLRLPFGQGKAGVIRSMIVQPDRKILLVGSLLDTDRDTLLMRFTPRGKLDGTFGTVGVVITDFAPGNHDEANAVILSADGKLRIAGRSGSPASFLLARYSASGVLEEHLLTPFTPNEDSVANDLTFQPDGKILAIGYTRNIGTTNGNKFAIARFTE
jgi:uncharacterized delta-60 repeat protein